MKMKRTEWIALMSTAVWAAIPLSAADAVKPGNDAAWIEDAGGNVVRDSAGRITAAEYSPDKAGIWMSGPHRNAFTCTQPYAEQPGFPASSQHGVAGDRQDTAHGRRPG